MSTTATSHTDVDIHHEMIERPAFKGVSWGKAAMWYFLISDTFTFAGFLISCLALRYAQPNTWPEASNVFNSVPGLSGDLPFVFVSIMTFILILSSVTMVRAVQEAHLENRKGVANWLLATILGGLIFLGCQYLEWSHLIDLGMTLTHNPFSPDGSGNTTPNFSAFFYLITGFHGLHVLIGIIINGYFYYKNAVGDLARNHNYGIIENIGLYWHFVDLVWVFVFLVYYLL